MRARIGIDLHSFDSHISFGGKSNFLGLIPELIRRRTDLDLYLLLDKTELLRRASPVFTMPHVRLVRMPLVSPWIRVSCQLPYFARHCDLSLMHTQYVIPALAFCPCVVTIHDVLYERFPELFSWPFRTRSQVFIRWSAKHAAHVITVSEYSRNEIRSLYGIDNNKISVIENGVDPAKFNPTEKISDAHVLARRGLVSGAYLLSVGRLDTRKNYLTLIRVISDLRRVVRKLVIVGQGSAGSLRRLLKAVEIHGVRDSVSILTDVNDDELSVLYRHSKLFVYPSYAEGFGIPLLEAMASGIPVVSSNTTSMPEVVGHGGVLIDPGDPEQLKAAIAKMLSNTGEYDRARSEALEQAKRFSWGTAAEKTASIYDKFLF